MENKKLNFKIGRLFRYYRSVYLNSNLFKFANEINEQYYNVSKFERGQSMQGHYIFKYLCKLPEGQVVHLVQDINKLLMEGEKWQEF